MHCRGCRIVGKTQMCVPLPSQFGCTMVHVPFKWFLMYSCCQNRKILTFCPEEHGLTPLLHPWIELPVAWKVYFLCIFSLLLWRRWSSAPKATCDLRAIGTCNSGRGVTALPGPWHHKVWKCYQSNSKVRVQVLENLMCMARSVASSAASSLQGVSNQLAEASADCVLILRTRPVFRDAAQIH